MFLVSEHARRPVIRAVFLFEKTAVFEQCSQITWSQILLLNWKFGYLPDFTGIPSDLEQI